MVVLGLAGFGLTGLMVWVAMNPEPNTAKAASIVFLAFGAVFAVAGLYLMVAIFRTATILTADKIERRDLWTGRRMRRSDIAGYRMLPPNNSFPRMKLLPKPNAGKGVTITLYRPDDDFHAWFEGIPDLAEEDRKRAEQAVLDDPDFGATVAERRRRLKHLSRLGGYGETLGIILSVWIFAWPRPYTLAILVGALAPVVALGLIAVTRGQFALYGNDARPKVGWLMYPALCLALRSLIDVDLYHWQDIAAPTVVVGCAAVLLSWGIDRKIADRPVIIAFYGLGALAYAYGLVTQADVLLDRSQPTVIATTVLDMRISSGKHTSYDVTLARWGDRQASEEIDVGSYRYRRLQKGEPACIYLSQGRVGIRWFVVDECPAPARSS